MVSRAHAPQAALARLHATDLFNGLSDPALTTLASVLTIRRIPRRGAIFHQGDQGISLYVIEKGTIHCHMITEDGRELTVAVLGPGEIVGELAFPRWTWPLRQRHRLVGRSALDSQSG